MMHRNEAGTALQGFDRRDMPSIPPPTPDEFDTQDTTITASDRWAAFLNHAFSAEGAMTVLLILGIVVDQLKQYGNLPPWAVTAIAVLGAVYVIGSKIAAAFGHGALNTVLRTRGKLAE